MVYRCTSNVDPQGEEVEKLLVLMTSQNFASRANNSGVLKIP